MSAKIEQLRESIPGQVFSVGTVPIEFVRTNRSVVKYINLHDVRAVNHDHPALGTTLMVLGKDINFSYDVFQAYIYQLPSGIVAIKYILMGAHYIYDYAGETTDATKKGPQLVVRGPLAPATQSEGISITDIPKWRRLVEVRFKRTLSS